MSPESMLRVEQLAAGYGKGQVLRDVGLEVPTGGIAAVLGSNGAGKTTLLRAISGQIRRVEGRVFLAGTDISRHSVADRVRTGIAHCPQGRRIFGELTVLENLQLGAYMGSEQEVREDLERWFEVFPVLGERQSQKGGSLSGGEQQMLAIARAMMSRPKLLMLDEPSMGLSPTITRRMFEVVRGIAEEGVAILVVEQNVGEALRIASTAHVIRDGSLEPIQHLDSAGRQRIVEAYLGGGTGRTGDLEGLRELEEPEEPSPRGRQGTAHKT